jgi:hypothetical protein
MIKLIKILTILLHITSCSVVQKAAVNTTADLAQNGQKQLQTLNSWETIKVGIPAQIAFAETLIASNPTNTTLLTQLIKGYAALGFVVYETQMFNTQQELKDYYAEQAQLTYSRALNWGEKFLLEKNIKWNQLLIGVSDVEKLEELLDNHLSMDDHVAVFFIGQAWASLINLSRDQVRLVNHLPIARNLIQYVCKKNPDFEDGMCPLFEAIYQISRPKMLGGNPELGAKLFKETIKKYPYNLLYAISYLQYYLAPQKKFQEFTAALKNLDPQFKSYIESQKRPNYLNLKNEFLKHPENNLYNTMAHERFTFYKKNSNQYK